MFYLADRLVSDGGRLYRTAYAIVSKSHVLLEERANKIVVMMAQSCYNPEEALKVSVDDMKIRPMLIQGRWDRMAKADQSATPQFLSTHPTVSCLFALCPWSLRFFVLTQDRNRLKRFQQWYVDFTAACPNMMPAAPDYRRLPEAIEKQAQSQCGHMTQHCQYLCAC